MNFNPTTFALEILNFLALMLILRALVFRPLREGIERRRALLAEREQSAVEALREARELEREVLARERSVETLRGEVLKKASEEAAQQRARTLEQARAETEAERSRARRLLDAERAAVATQVREVIIERSTEIAGGLLGELSPDSIDTALADLLISEIGARAHDLRESLEAEEAQAATRGDQPLAVEADFARLPTTAVRERLRGALERALDRRVALEAREDQGLGAGVLLRMGHLALDASQRGQLALLRDHARELYDAAEHGQEEAP